MSRPSGEAAPGQSGAETGGCPTPPGDAPQGCARERGSPGAGDGAGPGEEPRDPGRTAKKKRYSRHRKPPYTYLAMIALVIQASPGRKLKLSQIIQEIGALFPFFTAGYQGWKDSIRHNLSSNRCFSKLLKDPAKPKAKGNFWTVDVSQIPPDALKLQNTAISRQEAASFASDLAPFILHGWPYGCQGPQHQPQGTRAPSTNANSDNEESGYQLSEAARPSSSFTIDSLLSDFQEVGLSGKPREAGGQPQPIQPPPSQPVGDSLPISMDLWGPVPIFRVSSGPPSLPWRPPGTLAAPRSFSSSSSSISTLSSLSSDEKEPGSRRSKQARGSRTPAKRPRLLAARESSSSSSDSDGSGGCTPAPSPTLVPGPCWEQLPTSYTKCVAPNVVAPPSGPPFFAFPSVPGLPYYSYRPPSYVSPVYWDLRPGPSVAPRQQGPQLPSLSVDLDHMVQGMPPNKSVYDVWVSHPGDIVHPALYSQGPVPGSMALTRYDSL
ncbi:forkhead activin signal transducer 3-like [Gopherus evgoodei]|uniref:forkhead activin signal transducer 3-like n=1 Tax=Gopherus evgoodei TaxID=1825980 RepID=UPI0011CFF075|nr:forkhead activin signal transducer 3-like [Gopherus evgoodei]